MGYKIGSFNLFKFSFQADKEIKKDTSKIADIIKSEGFDIIALQEVLNPNALELLRKKLGNSWRYRWDQPKIGEGFSGSKQEAEGYAFLWNSETMELSWSNKVSGFGNAASIIKNVAEPHIYDQYRIDKKNGQEELARNPYYGRFKPKRGFCEIRLINTHFHFGDNSKEEIRKRKNEFDILTQVIYHNISDRRYGNNFPAYTVILGDYNLNLNRTWNQAPFLEENVYLNDNGKIKHIITVQDQKTTLRMLKKTELEPIDAPNENKNAVITDDSSRGWANNYDHFTYDADRFAGTYIQARRIDTVRKYEKDDFPSHRREISDHIPIIMNLNLNEYESTEEEGD